MKDMPWLAALGELARSVSASYAVSYLLVLSMILATTCLGLSTTIEGALRWALFSLGLVISLGTLAFSAFVALRRPSLLRHEKESN